MKWSDETVEAVGEIISYTMDIDFGCFHNRKETAQAALAAVAQCKELSGAIVVEAVSLDFSEDKPQITLEADEGTSFTAGKYLLIPFTEASDGK
jgi:uncharacterized protein with HEPN domain